VHVMLRQLLRVGESRTVLRKDSSGAVLTVFAGRRDATPAQRNADQRVLASAAMH
jgi:hypothetical protein